MYFIYLFCCFNFSLKISEDHKGLRKPTCGQINTSACYKELKEDVKIGLFIKAVRQMSTLENGI